MTKTTRVRFAPSPTGFLHIGSARTALFNFLFSHHNKGVFVLRIEDTDVHRSSEDFYNDILNGLRWLGIHWDEGPEAGGDKGPYRQSQRTDIYESYLKKLWDSGSIYECYCTPEELELRRKEAISKGMPPKYDGRCRELTDKMKENYINAGRKPSVRFKVVKGKYVVKDIVRGDVEFDSEQIGDFILKRSDGGFSFHFANVVDDALMEISHIIRGEDLLPSTPRHIMLYKAFGFDVPCFAHLPMILGSDRTKLSKRHGATSVMDYKKDGFLPECIINFLALLGWTPSEFGSKDVNDNGKTQLSEIMSIDGLIEKFTLERISKSGAVFNLDKLKWMNGVYIRNLSDTQLYEASSPFIKDEYKKQNKDLNRAVQLVKDNLSTLNEVNEYIKVFFESPEYNIESIKNEIDLEKFLKIINALAESLKETTDETDDMNIKNIVKKVTTESGFKGKDLYMSIRLGVTGVAHGPDLVGTLVILGKEEILGRLNTLQSKLKR